ncbi:MAG: methyl-accepting chemotaxis protein [Spirochaetales bacterium]|nr:methyl-accepting chemotaxis protein [Spirochaetales bacterium]
MKKIQSLKFRLILVISLAVFVTSSSISMASSYYARKGLEGEVENTLQGQVDSLALEYSTWLEMEVSQLVTFSIYLSVDYDSPAFYDRLAREAARTGYNSIAPVDAQGTLHLAGGVKVDLSGRDYLKELFRTKEPVISDPVFSAVEGEEDLFTILIAVPIFTDGQLTGALVGQKNANFLSENLQKYDLEYDAEEFVLNGQGVSIAHTDYQKVLDRDSPLEAAKNDPALADLGAIAQRMIDGERGTGEYSNKGQARIVAFSPIAGTSWSAVISAPHDVVFASVAKISRILSLISILIEVISVALAVLIGGALTKPIIKLWGAMDEISQGDADLTRRLQLNRRDELEELAQAFNRFLGKLQQIISALRNSQGSLENVGNELSSTAQETASAINQIMANIEGVRKQSENLARNTGAAAQSTLKVTGEISSLDNLIDEQVNSSSEASSVIEEMIANINEVGRSIDRMARESESLMTSMLENRQKQQAMDERVHDISSQSELLMEANTIISGIASRTNLLAMNAAIEAAHAGEAGRGFSVVADEIRKLAENSAQQSHTIGSELKSIQEKIKEVVLDTQSSRQAFAGLSSGIEEMGGLVKQVEYAMQEQSQGSQQVLGAIGSMNSIGNRVKEKASEMLTVSRQAALAMDDLTESSLVIQGSMDEMAAGAEQINKAASQVSSLAGETADNIKEMDDQIGKFTV